MESKTSSRSQRLQSMYIFSNYLWTGWSQIKPLFSRRKPWESFIVQIVLGPPKIVSKGSGGQPSSEDYRHLIQVTMPNQYPIPHIQDFSANLAEAQVFTNIVLVRGYPQILVLPEDIKKCSNQIFGLDEFLRCLLGSEMLLRPSSSLWTQSVEVSL